MARKAIPTLPDVDAPQTQSKEPKTMPVMEQSWVPPALLLDGVMVASLRGIRRLPLTDEDCLRLKDEWERRGKVALASTEVVDFLQWPKEDRP